MEKKRTLHYPTNEKVRLRDLPLEDSCMSEKQGDDIVNTWIYTYAGEKMFHGYKNLPAGPVTPTYAGDTMLDMHDVIPVSVKDGKPNINDEDAFFEWIGTIFGARLFRLSSKVKGNFKNDLVDYALIAVIFIEIIGWAIRFATGG